MSAETPAAPGQNDEHYLQVFRRNFRNWRSDRPFWAGLFIVFGGFPIAYFPYANLQLGHLTLAMSTTAGAGSLIIGVLLIVLGISLWFQKHVRTFAGVAAILLALVSLPVSNLGGFLVGFLFAMIGGAMAVSWVPGEPAEELVAPESLDEGDEPADPAAQPVDFGKPADAVGDPNDLSGTSPTNGANGRHSAG
ncbi:MULTISPECIES: DUF6114 domain-containing protein [unclassified Streptomyces]|uniref:DUF6114 domain-containing protein n=1 Tax=unclassified Streptomyces TaxID=2593676 RepID=UPI00224D7F4A|nr:MULTISPECIES: DUF6114 domain-containing protein [unclassified Streptomyces]MCX4988361.1 DUF6114 domain-containing protein [Streptomyces sp. NBC_00568]MCX5006434.1 DUF6114 domain-containing protein [Streptomyces sp. NBC_00638]